MKDCDTLMNVTIRFVPDLNMCCNAPTLLEIALNS